MGIDRHEAGRTGAKPKLGTRLRFGGPPKDEPWIWKPRELINSLAHRSLSGNSLRVIDRICEEHMAHGGFENGNLIVTHEDFIAYGIRAGSIADAIREAEFFGFIRVDRGRAYKGHHEPSIYRLTWIGDRRDAPPTNDWKAITVAHVANWKTIKRQNGQRQRQNAARRKQVRTAKVIPIGLG